MMFLEDVVRFPFLQAALLTGILAGISTGIVGSYVVARRITYLAGSIAHFVLGGMGVARYLQVTQQWAWLTPIHGAILAAVIAAGLISWVSRSGRQREDSVIGALWAVGMAVGILFIYQTPGYNEDLMSYLFGNILMVGESQLLWLAGLDVLVVGVGLFFYNSLLSICFDEEFASLRGVPPSLFYTLLLLLTALTVVVLISVVGIILVIALLTLPATIAGQFVHRLSRMMALATVLSIAFSVGGLWLSYQPNLPVGASIILLAGVTYLLSLAGTALLRRRKERAQ